MNEVPGTVTLHREAWGEGTGELEEPLARRTPQLSVSVVDQSTGDPPGNRESDLMLRERSLSPTVDRPCNRRCRSFGRQPHPFRSVMKSAGNLFHSTRLLMPCTIVTR